MLSYSICEFPPNIPTRFDVNFLLIRDNRWEDEQVRRGATRPATQRLQDVVKSEDWGGNSTNLAVNGNNRIGSGGGEDDQWIGATERPRFLGVAEMQKALREAGTELREKHERNERQLQVVSRCRYRAAAKRKMAFRRGRVIFQFFHKNGAPNMPETGETRLPVGPISQIKNTSSAKPGFCPVSLSMAYFARVVLFFLWTQLVSELETQTKTEEKLGQDQENAVDRFNFFQRTRDHLSILCGMLRAKVRAVAKSTSLAHNALR